MAGPARDRETAGSPQLTPARREHVAAVIAAVIAGAVRTSGAKGVVLLDDGSPEAGLAAFCARQAVGDDAVWCATATTPVALGMVTAAAESTAVPQIAVELQRAAARVLCHRHDALAAHPANKTALLLAPPTPPETLLPLGDLYADDVRSLQGAWSAPPTVCDLAELAGGIDALDRALRRLLERRENARTAFEDLPTAAQRGVAEALATTAFHRRYIGLVPKLGERTLGIDLRD